MFVLPPVQVLVDVQGLRGGGGAPVTAARLLCLSPPPSWRLPICPSPCRWPPSTQGSWAPDTGGPVLHWGAPLNTWDLSPRPQRAFPDWNHQGCHRPHHFRACLLSPAQSNAVWFLAVEVQGCGRRSAGQGLWESEQRTRTSSESRNFPNSRWCRSKIEEPWSLAKGFWDLAQRFG